MKNLYYVVEKHLDETDSWNGIRTISVYNISSLQEMNLQFELECESDDLGNYFKTDEEEIQQYLDDNGMGDSEHNLIQL